MLFCMGNTNFQTAEERNEESPNDVSKAMKKILEDLQKNQHAMMFDGEVLDDESRELLISSLEQSLRIILEPDEWQKIIDRFQPPSRFYIPLMIGYYTGMRISEVFALTWDDIDFENRTININKQVVKRNYGVDVREVLKRKGKKEEKSAWYFQSLKTDSSERVIKFGDTLYKALKAESVRQKENELMYAEYFTIQVIKSETDEKNNEIDRIIPVQKCVNPTLPRTRLICISENGEYTSTDSFKYPSRIIHHELGLAFDFHSLRHTHATRLIEAGVSPKTVQDRLGHQNIETTLQTYVHNTEQMEENAVDAFEKIATGV